MKKSAFLLFLFLISACFFAGKVSAATEQRIFDQAALFSDTDKQTIETELAAKRQEIAMDIVVVTTNNTAGKTSEEYADDYYDNHDFGVGTHRDGVLLLIDMENRQVQISTTGKMIAYLSDRRINEILDDVQPNLTNQNYANGVSAFLTDVTTYYKAGIPKGYSYNETTGKLEKIKTVTALEGIIAFILAVVIGGGFYLLVSLRYQLKMGTYTYPYREKGALELTTNEDHLIDTFITTRRIPKNNGNGGFGGGSSTHTSSSGTSHGGGGRGF